MPSLKRFTKQPGETLDYDVDYEDFFGPEDTDDIDGSSSLTAEITMADGSAMGSQPPHLQIHSGPIAIGGNSARRAKIWLKGGVDGSVYKVTIKATTHEGRVVETDFLLKVKEL